MTPWEVHGRELANCNCNHACPCQFSSRPSHGYCQAALAYEIDRGHYGDVRLDGVRAASMYTWPGAVHEGNGTMQIIFDEGTTPAQRDALQKIITGQDTNDAATMWWIYATTSPNKLESLVKKIDFDLDIDARRARIVVADTCEITAEPIRNQVSGAEHRIRIDLPHGFEFAIAEIGNGTTRSTGAVAINYENTYAQFCEMHLGNAGVIR